MAVIVTNRIPVAAGHTMDFEDRFRRRIGLIDGSPGFLRNEVHRPRPMTFSREEGTWTPDPDKDGYYEVKTWWATMDDFVAWTRSESFRAAHADRPPKEMFRGPSELVIHEIVTSSDLSSMPTAID